MSEENKQKIRDTKRKLKKVKPLIIEDIKSNKYTSTQLIEKYKEYKLRGSVIKYYKRKLKSGATS